MKNTKTKRPVSTTKAAPRPRKAAGIPASEEARARLAAIVASSDDAIISKDLNGVIVTWNRGAQRLFGYTAAEAVGKSVTMLIPPERLDEEPGILQRIRKGQSVDHYETVRRRKDGVLLDISLTVSPIVDAGGRVIGVSKIARDITESKRDRAALAHQLQESRRMQKKLSLLVESCHALMGQSDPKAMLTVMLAYARQVLTADAYAVWRYDYGEARWRVVFSEGVSAWAVKELVKNLPSIPPDKSVLGKDPLVAEEIETTPWLAPVREVHRTEGNKSLLVAPLKLHGEYAGTIVFYYKKPQRFTEDRIQVAGALGDLAASAITGAEVREQVRHLTERLEEKVLERTRDLTASNQELEAFCYSISHDLRTPLRAIDGFTQLVLKSAGDKLEEAEKEHFRRVRAASQRMSQLIDDLLNLSRLTRGEIQLSDMDLTALAGELAEELRSANPGRRVSFIAAPGLRAQGDVRLVRAALANLLGNAWKFTGRHAAARIEFGAADGAFYVSDDGAGFDMAYVGNLFRAFQRLHTPDEFPGNGIGLATVQRAIHRHGGRVWARGEVEKGATFFFTLAPPPEERSAVLGGKS